MSIERRFEWRKMGEDEWRQADWQSHDLGTGLFEIRETAPRADDRANIVAMLRRKLEKYPRDNTPFNDGRIVSLEWAIEQIEMYRDR